MKLECQFKALKPNETHSFSFSAPITQQVTGFTQFQLGFAGDDHHLKAATISLSVNQQGNLLTVTPRASLVDSSGHNLDPASSSITVVAIAIVGVNNDNIRFGNASGIQNNATSTPIAVPCTTPLVLQSLLAGFNLSYEGSDHHIKAMEAGVGAQISGNNASIKADAEMYDGSGNFAAGSVDGGLVASCDSSQPLLVMPSTNLQNGVQRLTFPRAMANYYSMMTAFSLAFADDDHHVKTLGANFACGAISGAQVDVSGNAFMKDGSGHVQDNSRSYVAGVVFGF